MSSLVDRQPPENIASRKALEMTRNNPELIEMVKSKIIEIGKEFKCEEELEVVLTAVNDTLSMAEYVKKVLAPLYIKCWNGTITPAERDMLMPGYFNYQDLLAQKKLQEIDESVLADKMKNVVMVYDVTDKSEFVRAYMSNGKQLDINNSEDKKIIDLLDQCFHSWLVFNQMSSQDGVIFNTSKLDKKGNYVEKAKPENIVNLLNHPERGLDVSVKKQGRELEINVQRFNQKPEAAYDARAEKHA